MRLSKLNIKKINLLDVDDNYSAQDILMKMGELYQFESGIYAYGTIWLKLQKNIENIIIEELDKADCMQVEFPKLQPKKIWEQSNRWSVYTKENDIMYTIENNLGEYGLAPTAEECATIYGSNRLLSYKNLPAIYYQISEKFRKEIRARGYLFRPRTFTMMDAYSFDKSKEDMNKTYNKMHEVYLKIFERLGIKIIPTVSDGGTMGGNVSEEFQAVTALGEDTILYDEDLDVGINKEVLDFENKDEYLAQLNIKDISKMKEYSSVELGNNFQLGTKYSESMGLFFKDEQGKEKPYYMGCYGIGVGRIVATILENNVIKENEKIKGFSIPANIAPYKVQIIYKEDKKNIAEDLYKQLNEMSVPCIIDDRDDESIGSKIKDAHIMGTPYVIVLGNRFENGIVEIEETKSCKKYEVDFEKVGMFFKTRNSEGIQKEFGTF